MLSKFIGIPFDTLQCWELVQAVYGELGISLPPYTAIDAEAESFEEIQGEPEMYDILVFSLYGQTLDHVGIYVGGGQFLHATEGSGVCIERLHKYMVKLKHVYRRKGGIQVDSFNHCTESI